MYNLIISIEYKKLSTLNVSLGIVVRLPQTKFIIYVHEVTLGEVNHVYFI